MAKTLCVSNRKGGVGKTTSTAALAGEFASRGMRTLCIDMDPQGSLSLIAGFKLAELDPAESTMALVLPDLWDPEIDPSELPVAAPWGGDVIPTNNILKKAKPELESRQGSIKRLDRSLRRLHDRYDVILIDTRPSDDVLVQNALMASDGVLIPVEVEYQAVSGLAEILNELDEFREYDKPELEVIGVFGTVFEPTLHCRDIAELLQGDLLPDGLVMRTLIPKRTGLRDAHGNHMGLREYDPSGDATVAYAALADEILDRLPDLAAVPVSA